MIPVAPAVGLEDFFDRLRAVNPFTDNRVNKPSAADVDVAEIHQAAFARLTELAQESLAGRRGLGVVLWGEAGVGKSHLLSRLGAGPTRTNGRTSSICIISRPPRSGCRARCCARRSVC